MNILISEDDKEILGLYELVIAGNGYTVFTADNYLKTIHVLQNEKIDLWVLDYWLGKVKTEELLNMLKHENVKRDFPILLISAITNLSQVAEKLNLKYYLKKPFDLDEFILKIKQINHDQNGNSNRR